MNFPSSLERYFLRGLGGGGQGTVVERSLIEAVDFDGFCRLIGDLQVEMRVFPGPGAEPIVSNELTASREWILGGRYVEENLQGQFAGNPSARLAIIGYNNLEDRFELATFDTFEPGFMIYTGEAEGDTVTVDGVSIEAGFGPTPTGRHRDLRFDLTIEEDRSIQRIYVTYPGEEEFLFVEQIFTPAK